MPQMKATESLTASEITQFLQLFTENLDLLAPLLDDLNALEGADFDTGTNALHTLKFVKYHLENYRREYTELTSAQDFLTATTTYARNFGRGHIGLMLTSLFAALGKTAKEKEIRPVDLRAFLKQLPQTIQNCFSHPHPALKAMSENAATVANDTPDPITNPANLIGFASLEAQDAMVETTQNGWTNPGAAVLAIFLASLHSIYDGDKRHLSTAVQMITDLATTSSKQPLPANPPRKGAEYSVSFLIDTTQNDYHNLCENLSHLGVRYSTQGNTDLLGMGSWRFHLDTDTPTTAIPEFGWVRNIVVRTNRYGELIGEDELAVQQETSGVLYLSRPTWQRPETARVLVLNTSNNFVEETASSGAWVLVKPVAEDIPLIVSLLHDAPGNVAVVLPGNADAYDTAKRAEKQVENINLVYPENEFSDGVNLICAQHTASIFVPQIGEKTQALTQQLLETGIRSGQRRTAVISVKNLSEVTTELTEMIGYGLSEIIIFAEEPGRGTMLGAAVEDAFEIRNLDACPYTITYSETPHIVLVNG